VERPRSTRQAVHGPSALTLPTVAVAYLISIYNRLVALRNDVKNAFAQIDVQLKRRYDLIPNLVETAKGYMKHERQTLEAVIAARDDAGRALRAVEADPSKAQTLQSLAGAEGVLSGALGKLLAVAEAYPDLSEGRSDPRNAGQRGDGVPLGAGPRAGGGSSGGAQARPGVVAILTGALFVIFMVGGAREATGLRSYQLECTSGRTVSS